MWGIDSRWLFTGLVGLIAVQRLLELGLARRSSRWLLARGGVEVGAGHYPWMVALHTCFLASCLAEVWLLGRPFVPSLAAAALLALGAASALRYWTVRALGERWTTRVIVVPGAPLVTSGPYRLLRHPNYVAVALEVAALPLVHGAWLTATFFSAANGVLLAHRIRTEDGALARSTRSTRAARPAGAGPARSRAAAGGRPAPRGAGPVPGEGR